MLKTIFSLPVVLLCVIAIYGGGHRCVANPAEGDSALSIREMELKVARREASPEVVKKVEEAENALDEGKPYLAKEILMRLQKTRELNSGEYRVVDAVEREVDAALGAEREAVEKKIATELKTERLLSEYRKERLVEDEMKRAAARSLVEQARIELYEQNNPGSAAELARRATSLDPENEEAEKLLIEARTQLGEQPARLIQEADLLSQQPRVTLEALKREFQAVKEEAADLFERGEYERSAEKWRRAKTYVNVLSVYEDMQDQVEVVEKGLSDAERKAEEKQRLLAERREKEAREQMEEAVQEVEKAAAEKEAELLDKAWKLMREKRFEEARKIVKELQYQEPAHEGAEILAEMLGPKEHEFDMAKLEQRSEDERLALLRKTYEQALPYADEIKFPEKSIWRDIISQREPVSYPSQLKVYTDEEEKVDNLLDTTQEVTYVGDPITDVVERLPLEIDIPSKLDLPSKLNLVLNKNDLPYPEPEITLHVETQLRRILDSIVEQASTPQNPLMWKIDGNLVKIANPESLKEYELRVYDIRDLLLDTADRKPIMVTTPDVSVGGDDDDDDDDDDDGGEEAEEAFYVQTEPQRRRAEALQALIKKTVRPDSWAPGEHGMIGGIVSQLPGGGGDDDDDDEIGAGWGDIWREKAAAEGVEEEGVPTGGRIYGRGANPGDLIIVQTPDVHEEIEMLLKQLRRAQHIQVNVEARFLRVRMNFLEEIGFDWSKIDTTPDTWNYHGAELRTGLPLFSGEDYDNAESFGLNVDFGVFDSFELQGLFRAIQTRNDVRTLAAPIVTLMNGQLGYLSVSTSYNYVSDVDTESDVVTSEGGPPVITRDRDIETDNVADVIGLIVRPIVSADRKYVYLEAAPIVTEVLRFDKYVISSTTGAGVPQENTQDLPVLRAERVEATVAVPDRGILVMGGLNQYTQDRREKGVPVFSKIPVLRRLFQSEGENIDQNTFLILLRPRIIILPEEESRAF